MSMSFKRRCMVFKTEAAMHRTVSRLFIRCYLIKNSITYFFYLLRIFMRKTLRRVNDCDK